MHNEEFEHLVFIETAHSWLDCECSTYTETFIDNEEEDEILFI